MMEISECGKSETLLLLLLLTSKMKPHLGVEGSHFYPYVNFIKPYLRTYFKLLTSSGQMSYSKLSGVTGATILALQVYAAQHNFYE